MFAGFSGARKLANTLGDGALYRHIIGDDVEAVERLHDILHIATSLNQDDTSIA